MASVHGRRFVKISTKLYQPSKGDETMKALLIALTLLLSTSFASEADAGCRGWFPGKRVVRVVKNRRVRPVRRAIRFELRVLKRVRPGVIFRKR